MHFEPQKDFFLIDQQGRRRIPSVNRSRGGYAIHPVGKGNDNSAAEFTMDAKRIIQAVILEGKGIRCSCDGQTNTVGLGKRAIKGYWLAPQYRHWVSDAAIKSIEIGSVSPNIETRLVTERPSAEDDISSATDIPRCETERQAVIAARLGQGVFRSKLDAYWQDCCAVTACSERALLRASHIQPWRDSTNTERLNPYNGLLLSAHLDAAFDNGLISFDDTGKLLLHPEKFSAEVAATVGINSTMRLKKVDPQHLPFLSAHRSMHGFATNWLNFGLVPDCKEGRNSLK